MSGFAERSPSISVSPLKAFPWEVAHWVPRHGSHQSLSDFAWTWGSDLPWGQDTYLIALDEEESWKQSVEENEQTQRQKAFHELFDYFLGLCCLIWTCLIRNKINKNTKCSLVLQQWMCVWLIQREKKRNPGCSLKRRSNLCKYGLP